MQDVYKYIGTNTDDPQFSRAYREGLIFSMINVADNYYRAESLAGVDLNTTPLGDILKTEIPGEPLSFDQKRRFRNEVYRIASDHVKSFNDELKKAQANGERLGESEIHTYDREVVINAFFDSSLGQNYANKREEWLTASDTSTGFQRYVNTYQKNIKTASIDVDLHKAGEFAFIVSPYDPGFADSDNFRDAGSDQIGYVFGVSNGKDTGFSSGSTTGSKARGRNIVGVYSGSNYGIANLSKDGETDQFTRNKGVLMSRGLKPMYSDTYNSGYSLIERYIKKNNKKRDIREYLIRQMETYAQTESDGTVSKGRAQAEGEYQFMSQVCRYLDEKGIDFDIEVSGDKLVAKLGSRCEIRLLDRAEPKYRGRIYDNGVITRLGRAMIAGKPSSDEEKYVDSLISNEDCMSVIKYYFGEDVKIGLSGFEGTNYPALTELSRRNVGEHATYPNRLPFEGGADNSMNITAHGAKTRKGDNSLLLGIKKYEFEGKPRKSVLKLMVSPSCVSDIDELPSDKFEKSISINEYGFSSDEKFAEKPADETAARIRTRLRLPDDKVFPDDLDTELGPVTYTDPDGNVQSIMLMKTINHISDEHLDYYKHLSVREELDRWTKAAREAHAEIMDVDNVISEFQEHSDDPLYEYPSPDDKDISDLQSLYWNILSGRVKDVKLFGREESVEIGDDIEDKISIIKQHYAGVLDDYFGSVPELTRDGLSVENHGIGIVPEHVAKYVTTDNSYGNQRNINYIEHMLSRLGSDYSHDFVKGDSYQASVTRNKMLKYKQDGAKEIASFAWGHVCTPLDTLDPEKLKHIKGLEDKPVTRNVLMKAMETLINSGCKKDTVKVAIDENGVIAYKGVMPQFEQIRRNDKGQIVDGKGNVMKNADGTLVKESDLYNNSKNVKIVSGTIGQVMEPGKYGEILLKSPGGADKILIPGYDAYFVDPDPDNPQSRRERLRLVGYEQRMCEAVAREIHRSVFTLSSEYNFVPHSTDLNSVYRKLTSMVHDPDEFYSRLPKDPEHPTRKESIYAAVIATEANRCRFPTEYIEGATTNYQSMLNNPNTDNAKNFDYYYGDKCEYNMRCIRPDMYDVFDPDATGTAKNQGIVLYLNEGVTVDPHTGKPTSVENGRCPLMNHWIMKYMHHDPFARKTMAFNTVMTAKDYALHTGVALMTMNGYNFDDGFVISKKFSETYKVEDTEKALRSLLTGDKISDLHGDKGVNARIIDPMWASDEIAKRLSVTDGGDIEDKNRKSATVTCDIMDEVRSFDVIFDNKSKESHAMQAARQIQKELGIDYLDDMAKVFRDNPNLEVVASPYSPLSRYNGGTIREMMDSPGDLVLEKTDKNGNKVKSVIEGGIGYLNMAITDMTVDVKSHEYGEEEMMQGKGRKASPQLAWSIQSRNANFIMAENYATNSSSVNNVREYNIAVGLDMDPNGYPLSQYTAQPKEARKLIKLPDEDCIVKQKTSRSKSIIRLDADFFYQKNKEMLSKLNRSGGFMELPFQLDFKTRKYANMPAGNTEYLLPETGQTYTVGGEVKPTYGMPVLPPELRSGQELHDGTTRAHDYTNRYVSVYKQALLYMGCEKELAENKNDASKMEYCRALTQTMEKAKEVAQAEFDRVVSDIAENKFNSKYGIYTEGLMSNRLNNSATSVWSAEPRLDLNQVGMNEDHARKLGLCDKNGKLRKNAGVMIWRDPCLNSGNARWMKVVVMNHLKGIAINPLADASFDGDFDGDSIGERAYMTKEARREGREKFSLAANMLNTGTRETIVDKDGVEHIVHPLYIQTGLDVCSNAYNVDKSIDDERIRLTLDINKMEDAYRNNPEDYTSIFRKGLTGDKALMFDRERYCEQLNGWAHKALDGIGVDHIVVKDNKTVIESLQHIVDSKAKGDAAKMDYLCGNIGITYTRDADGHVQMDTIRDITDKDGKIITQHELDGTDVEANLDNQALTSYKTDDTAFAGTVSKLGMLAVRDIGSKAVDATLNCTYAITQATLQSKKDSAEALSKDTILKTWNRDAFDGYKLTGFNHNSEHPFTVSESFEELNSTKHERITEKQPKMQRDKSDPDRWVPVKDEQGRVVMEDRPVKCTREEYIYQINAVMKAFKVDVHPRNIAIMADSMIMKDYSYSKADVDTLAKNPDAFVKKQERTVVGGFSAYADKYGSLLDKAAYGSQRLAAVVREAESVDKRPIFRGLDVNAVDMVAISDKLKEASNIENDEERKAVTAKLEAEQKALYERLPNSSTFAPMSFVRNVAAYNLGDMDSFKPVGRKDAFLSPTDYAKGYGIMGESQADYEARMRECKNNGMSGGGIPAVSQTAVPTDVQSAAELTDEDKPIVSNVASQTVPDVCDESMPFTCDESLNKETASIA